MARMFNDVLRDVAGGVCHDELSDALHDLTQQVIEARKKGDITLKPNGEASVIFTYQVTASPPKLPNRDTIFFTTAGGDLVKDDPQQMKMELRDVAGAPDPKQAKEA